MYKSFRGDWRDKLKMPSRDWVDIWKPIKHGFEMCAEGQGEFPAKVSDAGSHLGSHHIDVRS